MAGAFDDADCRTRPDRCERMRGRRRAQKIMAALNDDARDCLQLAERFITENELVDAETLRSWRDQAAQQVDEAFNIAQKEPVPEAAEEDWCAISTRALCDQAE